jgi:hypothetical protein
VEIRRNGVLGSLENGIIVDDEEEMTKRNKLRSLEISFEKNLVFQAAYMKISFSNINKNQNAIGKRNENYTDIVSCYKTLDVSLFHEMLHWYHRLRTPQRQIDEENIGQPLVDRDLHLDDYSLGQYYWANIEMQPDQRTISEYAWRFNPTPNASFEEMRTILGVYSDIEEYKEGDDISENLYRKNKGIPLRYGHIIAKNGFYEDNRIIDKVNSVCDSAYKHYETASGNVQYLHNVGGSRRGVGYFCILEDQN